ncbi:MAG: GNAT family protein [Nitriliruptoraceae bacterium]
MSRSPERSPQHRRGRVERSEVHVRVLVADDAAWVVATDEASATALAPSQDWDPGKLAAELDEGVWASDDRWAWGVIVSGEPAGFAQVTGLESGDARMSIRIDPKVRGRGVGREVLRQLADHHFGADPDLHRLTGRVHEHNVPMQRVFNAAGFRMEARYRDSVQQADGRFASEWGYALTRPDWEAGNHRNPGRGSDLHGLTFELDETVDGPVSRGLAVRFLQEGRRTIARYDADRVSDGELAGLLVDDLLQYRFVHVEERRDGVHRSTGRGRCRVQRRNDGRIELVDQWSADSGANGRRLLVERVAT